MADAQPEAVLDLEAPPPYSIVITALQGQKHPALSDAQPRCSAAPPLPASLFAAVLQQNKKVETSSRAAGILSKSRADGRISSEELCCHFLFH